MVKIGSEDFELKWGRK